jgi:hypothetical protein
VDQILKRGVRASKRFVIRSGVENVVIGSSRMRITVVPGADQVVIEETGEIAEGETVKKSPRAIDRTATTDQGEVIDRTAPIVLTRLNALIALRKSIALSVRIDSTDWTDRIIPAVGEIVDSCVPSSLHEPLKEWIFLSVLDTPNQRRLRLSQVSERRLVLCMTVRIPSASSGWIVLL